MYSLGKIKHAETGEPVEVFTDGRGLLFTEERNKPENFVKCDKCGNDVLKDDRTRHEQGYRHIDCQEGAIKTAEIAVNDAPIVNPQTEAEARSALKSVSR